MKEILFLSVVLVLFMIPIALTESHALTQGAGTLTTTLKPGETKVLKWQLESDTPAIVELSMRGEGSEFLSFESQTIDVDGTVYVDVTVSIPSSHPGNVELSPRLYAVESGGAQVVSGLGKKVLLVVGPNENPEPVKVEPKTEEVDQPQSGGCLIATAAYGTELAPQVQFLREIRDNTVLSTSSGTSFMAAFNEFYYSFSPTIADLERENPVFKEGVRLFITPMITTLSIMTLADPGSEAEVLGFGISVIMLNIGMYIAAPTIVGYKVRKHLKNI